MRPLRVRYRRFSLQIPGEILLLLLLKACEVLLNLVHF